MPARVKKTEEKKPDSRGRRIRREILSFLRPVLIACGISLLLTQGLFVNATVPTGSMKDTIEEKDRLIAFRLAYLWEEPKRGILSSSTRRITPASISSSGSSACRGRRWRAGTDTSISTAGPGGALCAGDAGLRFRPLYRAGGILYCHGGQPEPLQGFPVLGAPLCG